MNETIRHWFQFTCILFYNIGTSSEVTNCHWVSFPRTLPTVHSTYDFVDQFPYQTLLSRSHSLPVFCSWQPRFTLFSLRVKMGISILYKRKITVSMKRTRLSSPVQSTRNVTAHIFIFPFPTFSNTSSSPNKRQPTHAASVGRSFGRRRPCSGHMRCHRRGINLLPPPGELRWHFSKAKPWRWNLWGLMSEQSHKVAACLLMLANGPSAAAAALIVRSPCVPSNLGLCQFLKWALGVTCMAWLSSVPVAGSSAWAVERCSGSH